MPRRTLKYGGPDLGKMLPALRSEWDCALRCDERDRRGGLPHPFAGGPFARRCLMLGQNAADARDGNAFNACGYAGGGRRREEQFVVFTAAENLSRVRRRSEGQGRGFNLGGDADLRAG